MLNPIVKVPVLLSPAVLPAAIQRSHDEAMRILALLDRLLAMQAYVAGECYTIADIAHFG